MKTLTPKEFIQLSHNNGLTTIKIEHGYKHTDGGTIFIRRESIQCTTTELSELKNVSFKKFDGELPSIFEPTVGDLGWNYDVVIVTDGPLSCCTRQQYDWADDEDRCKFDTSDGTVVYFADLNKDEGIEPSLVDLFNSI